MQIVREDNDLPVPQETFSSSRKQYFSTKILSFILKRINDKSEDKILGVTAVDLYVPQLNFIFGEAQCPGKIALISSYRLRPESYGHPQNQDLLIERVTKEAIHELGHTFGLHHCENPKCVMFFSNRIEDTDEKNAIFCPKCNTLYLYQMNPRVSRK